jgi:hypothetical protein
VLLNNTLPHKGSYVKENLKSLKRAYDIIMQTLENLESERNRIDQLRAEYLKSADESMKEWFPLHLDWIDKVMNLSITIIGASITLFIALRDEVKIAVSHPENFFILWVVFVTSAILCLISRYAFAKTRLNQTNLFINGYKLGSINIDKIDLQKLHLASGTILPLDISKSLNHLDSVENILDNNARENQTWENRWVNCANFSSNLAFIFFIFGILVFLVIGFDIVYWITSTLTHLKALW